MKMLKIQISVVLVTLVIFLAGCVDLGESLRSDISADEHYSTPVGIQDLTVAMYHPLRWWYGNEAGDLLTVTGTDEFTYGEGTRSLWNDYDAGLNPSEDEPRGIVGPWNNFYRGINLANSLIGRVDNVEGITDAQRTRWKAEARFLRAHYYHILVQQFGGVHLTIEETIGVETEAFRADENEIWEVIIEDLEFAIENLPEQQSDWGRATANAARQNLAKVHLIRENWDDAARYAIDVINSGFHSLLNNYEDIWDPYNMQHEEVIWAVSTNLDTRITPVNAPNRQFGARVHTIPGISGDNQVYGGMTSRYKPTRFLIEEIYGNDPDNNGVNIFNDTRYFSSFREVWYYDDPVTLPDGAQIGDTAAYFPVAAHYQELTDEEVAAKPYVFLRMDDWTTRLYTAMVEKFRHQDVRFGFGRDIFVYRLAETYLIAVEALMLAGNIDDAVDYFNVVRARAAYPGEVIPLMTASELDLDEILNERSRELAGEYQRWHDLKRTGKLLERVRAYNDRAAPNIQEHHLLRPIPQSQIDRTSNNYPQNPGY